MLGESRQLKRNARMKSGSALAIRRAAVLTISLSLLAYLPLGALQSVDAPPIGELQSSATNNVMQIKNASVKVCSDGIISVGPYRDMMPIFALSQPPSEPPEYGTLQIWTIVGDEYPFLSLQTCQKWLFQNYFGQFCTTGGSLGANNRVSVASTYNVEGSNKPFYALEYWQSPEPPVIKNANIQGEKPSVALSVGAPQSAFMAFQRNRSGLDGGGSSIFFTMADDYWNDYGYWTVPQEIVGSVLWQPYRNETPAIAVDRADRVHVTYLRTSLDGRRDVYYLRNVNRGRNDSWDAESGRRLSWNGTDNHDMTIAASREGDTVVALWTATNSTGNDDLAYAYSVDGGATFSPALNLSSTAFNEGYPAVFIDPDTSTFHVAFWRDDSNATRVNNVLYTQASWGSPQYWTTPIPVLDDGSAASADYRRPAVVAYTYAGNHTVHVAWTDARNSSNLDIYMRNVTSIPLGCEARINPSSGPPPLGAMYTGLVNGGRLPYTYSWMFGDGGTASDSFGLHWYNTPGDYDAVFRVDDAQGSTCFDAVRVHVSYSVHLTPGHRLMSFPLAVSNDSVSSVLSSISGCYDYVRWYDPLDSSDHWKSYMPGRAYNDLTRLDNMMGFWINITATCDFTLSGTRPVSTMIDLHQGWNMIGFPSFNATYTVADLKADIGLAGVIVEAFDANAAPYYLQRVSDGYVMKAGDGYWVYVPSDATWTVNG